MKYIYYYIWVSLAFVHHRVSKLLFAINRVIFKIRKTSEDEQKKWKDDYNKGFLGFPGGMIDWAAFGLLLLIFFSVVLVFLISIDLEIGIFKSKVRLAGLFIALAGFFYYIIYFRNLPWLKDKIRIANKRYYL